ncbi:MAG: hypothetical protein R2873_29370 [Caldilineaceae bacterium]
MSESVNLKEVDTIAAAPAGFTVERAMYALLATAALLARVLGLGAGMPLLPLETAQALSAWRDAMNLALTGATTAAAQSPLLYTVQRFIFWMTDGGNDAWVRLFPALVGAALVLVPWALRRQLGRGGALILAGLIAVDPWLLAFSRLGDGAILSTAGALLLWAALLNWDRLSAMQWRLLAVATALFVLSGPLAWLLLPPLALTAVLTRPALPADNRERRWLLGLFAATVVIVATGWLAYWDGWGVLSSSVSAALSFVGGDLGYPLLWPVTRLIVDQPFVFAAGVIGLVLLLRGMRAGAADRSLTIGLGVWAVYGVVLLALPGRSPMTLLILGLPLLVAAAGDGAPVALLPDRDRLARWLTDRGGVGCFACDIVFPQRRLPERTDRGRAHVALLPDRAAVGCVFRVVVGVADHGAGDRPAGGGNAVAGVAEQRLGSVAARRSVAGQPAVRDVDAAECAYAGRRCGPVGRDPRG